MPYTGIGAVLVKRVTSFSVREATRSECDWMVKSHYLKKWPGVVVLRMALIVDSVAVGCCIFSLPPRETFRRYGGKTWELARLWVADSQPANSETFFISRCIASNWRSDGRTDNGRRTPRSDYKDVMTGKMYSRKSHVPDGVKILRVPRVSKYRFFFYLKK